MKTQKGKHFNKKEKKRLNKKIILPFSILILLLLIVIFVTSGNGVENTFFKNLLQNDEKVIEEKMSNMPDTMGDYNVLGIIVIDKIGVEKNILDKTTDESLNISVTKFYGPNLNEQGNFCITGHNYKDIFAYVENLELNDTFYIIDKQNAKKVTYKIYDKYTVNPTELDCLSQETNGKKEVTLITCNPGGLTRLILKAQEI